MDHWIGLERNHRATHGRWRGRTTLPRTDFGEKEGEGGMDGWVDAGLD
jgi:hypothetical protein